MGHYAGYRVIIYPLVGKTYRSLVQCSRDPRRKSEVTQFIFGFTIHQTQNGDLHITLRSIKSELL
jgi:hypothetical protein